MLTCKSFDTLGEGGERQKRTIRWLIPSNDSLELISASSGKVNEESGRCCSQPILSNIKCLNLLCK